MWGRGRSQEDEDMELAIRLSMQESQRYVRQAPTQGAVGMESVLKRETKIKNGTITVQVRKGDMTKEKVGAIVNAANKRLQHASGLAGAIVKSGGQIIQRESDKITDDIGEVPEGDCVYTTAGNLPCKYVIHAVGPMWPSSKSESLPIGQEEDKLLRSAVQNSLKIADTLQLTSISLPAISSGIFGYPKPRCARVLFDAVIDYVNSNATTLTEIRFTNFDDKTVDLFEEECKKR